jgi:enoyl-[acyl-carrier protein] reductase II
VHQNWKQAIVDAPETGTVFLNKFHSPALRALRTERTSRLEANAAKNIMPEFGDAQALYFGGDMEAAIPLSGQVAGRIESIKPVAEILHETRDEFFQILESLTRQYL